MIVSDWEAHVIPNYYQYKCGLCMLDFAIVRIIKWTISGCGISKEIKDVCDGCVNSHNRFLSNLPSTN